MLEPKDVVAALVKEAAVSVPNVWPEYRNAVVSIIQELEKKFPTDALQAAEMYAGDHDYEGPEIAPLFQDYEAWIEQDLLRNLAQGKTTPPDMITYDDAFHDALMEFLSQFNLGNTKDEVFEALPKAIYAAMEHTPFKTLKKKVDDFGESVPAVKKMMDEDRAEKQTKKEKLQILLKFLEENVGSLFDIHKEMVEEYLDRVPSDAKEKYIRTRIEKPDSDVALDHLISRMDDEWLKKNKDRFKGLIDKAVELGFVSKPEDFGGWELSEVAVLADPKKWDEVLKQLQEVADKKLGVDKMEKETSKDLVASVVQKFACECQEKVADEKPETSAEEAKESEEHEAQETAEEEEN